MKLNNKLNNVNIKKNQIYLKGNNSGRVSNVIVIAELDLTPHITAFFSIYTG